MNAKFIRYVLSCSILILSNKLYIIIGNYRKIDNVYWINIINSKGKKTHKLLCTGIAK